VLKRVGIIVGVLLIIGVGFGIFVKGQVDNTVQTYVDSVVIEEINLSEVADGKYEGEYGNESVYAKVEVTVKDHVITGIDILEHKNGLGSKGEKIREAIIQAQSVKVDLISGATASSKTIAKAVEQGLKR